MNFDRKTALVTGGSRGIGRAVAEYLASLGAKVAITYHADEKSALETIETIEGTGLKAISLKADAGDFTAAQSAVSFVQEQLGGLDILVANAGVSRDKVLWKLSEEDWDHVIGTNLKGVFNYIRAVSPGFRSQQSGKIVAITSINAQRGKFGQSNYAAAKAGVEGLVKTAARELGKWSINVNAVAPGLIETDMTANLPEEVKERAVSETALGRIGLPQDVAKTVAFLASDWSRHVTGQVLRVDGGQFIG